MATYPPQLQAELAALEQGFAQRQQWWDQMIARAHAARQAHRQEARNKADALKSAKWAVDGFNGAHRIATKYSTMQTESLHGAYGMQTQIKDFVDNPLRGIQLGSPVSHKTAFHGLYGTKFWRNYEAALKNGQHGMAGRMLNRGDGILRTVIVFCTGGPKAVQSWKADLAAARAQLPAHKQAWDKLQDVNKEIAKGEKHAAKIIHKMLNRSDLRKTLQTMQPGSAPSPELNLLATLAQSGQTPSKRDIRKVLTSQRDAINISSLKGQMQSLEAQAGAAVRAGRDALKAAQVREGHAASFKHSCSIARWMETKTSAILGGGVCLNMAEKLAAHVAGNGGAPERAAKLSHAAQVKMRRWVNPAMVENELTILEQPGFDPKALGRLPAHQYIFNTAGGAAGRTGNASVAVLKTAFDAVIIKPVA
ncbi:MAG TPA: hypothetical protein VL625_05315, partial [Patescibacteria group bacterium]|nr:hypothetical protein [Patescibacteria group bacterium]